MRLWQIANPRLWSRGGQHWPRKSYCLARIAGLAQDTLGLLVERMDQEIAMREPPCIAMLAFCDAGEREIRAHLTSRLTVNISGRRVLLRYYDPRVLLHLGWMLSTQQLAWLFGPVQRLAYWCFGSWHMMDKPQVVGDMGMPNGARLQRIGAINEVMAGLEGLIRHEQLVTASRAIEQALCRAERHGLIDETDRIAFAHHAMTVHPEFDRHPRIATLLAGVDGETRYRDSAGLLDEVEWRKIADSLDKQNWTRKVS